MATDKRKPEGENRGFYLKPSFWSSHFYYCLIPVHFSAVYIIHFKNDFSENLSVVVTFSLLYPLAVTFSQCSHSFIVLCSFCSFVSLPE